jgi:parallel beta-helix repeat protein
MRQQGIAVGNDCRVADNQCNANGSSGSEAGIYTVGSNNRIEGNNVTDNRVGITVLGAGKLIIRNSASGNTIANYAFACGNTAGPMVTSATIAGSSNPHANYEF